LTEEQRIARNAKTKIRYHLWSKQNLPAKRVIALRYRNKNPEQYMLHSSRGGAKRRSLEHTITRFDIFIPSKCPVFQCPFAYNTPYAPSLDRIDNSLGYVPGNVQVISRRANMMKHDATKEELRQFAEWILS
jgi:hypothetical protein